jgi:TPR repeat protein
MGGRANHNACAAGEPTGCVNLGWVHLNGTSTSSGAAAAPYFGKACKDRVVLGCLGLGTIYRDGRGTRRNPGRAAELFKMACDGGVKAACSLAKAPKP